MATNETAITSKTNGYRTAAGITAAALSFILGLGLSRVLFEGLFPQFLWLGRPLPIFLIAGSVALLGYLCWRWLAVNIQDDMSTQAAWTAAAIFIPLALNLFYLIDRQVDLVTSRFLLFTSLWLMVLFLVRLMARPATWRWLGFILLIAYLAPIYLLTLGQTVGQADTFEFQVVVPHLGIVHPTGYPLYLLLTKLFTFIPINSVAWRVNLASAVYGLGAVSLLYVLGWRFTGWAITSLLAAVLLGLAPTFWGQAVEAEVYTLHALLVVAALLLMREVGDWRLIGYRSADDNGPTASSNDSDSSSLLSWNPTILTMLLAFVLGLGLANHLTTIILLPAAGLTLFFAYRAGRYRQAPVRGIVFFFLVIVAFLLPLLLYSYLPLRWAAVNGEPMGFSRFLDWVIGGRFQGALQLKAWVDDPARYDIVGRLFLNDWPFSWTLVLIFVGAAYSFLWQWRYALILSLTWLGYVFYALNYYVPDLAVFLIPAQIIMAIWWLAGIVAGLDLVTNGPDRLNPRKTLLVEIVFVMAGIVPLLVTAAGNTWVDVDRSAADGRTQWARSVLALPLPDRAAILADSDKFPPLYYLQQAEEVRPDLDIMVLPDESAYRAELETRLADGQSIFLARYLPGLEGVYHLNSAGPLTQVSQLPLDTLPEGADPAELTFDSIQLLGYAIETDSPFSEEDSSVTLYWRAETDLDQVLQVYTRWVGEDYSGSISAQHPANNSYPTVAWQVDEIIADFHSLPRPPVNKNTSLELQVALAPPFTAPDDLAWQRVTTEVFRPRSYLAGLVPVRAVVGAAPLDGTIFPRQVSPGEELPVTVSGYGLDLDQLIFSLRPAGENSAMTAGTVNSEQVSPKSLEVRSLYTALLESSTPPGEYDVVVRYPDQQASCGWLFPRSGECSLGQIKIAGVPLPDAVANFEGKIALLAYDLPESQLHPGGKLPINLTWQALGPLSDDYTVFVQVLDGQDRIVGQVDSWPVQGTFPTSQWATGQVVEDPYLIQLDEDLPPGSYKLNIGWYLLETLRRLQLLDPGGAAIDDKVVVPGLQVSGPKADP